MPCVGTQKICATTDPCRLAAAAPAVDLSGMTEGPKFGCAMLAKAKYLPRFALLYGPLLLAATGPWDPLLNVVNMPDGLDVSSPSSWLVPTPNRTGGFFSVKGAMAYTYAPYMLIQGEQYTTYATFPGATTNEL